MPFWFWLCRWRTSRLSMERPTVQKLLDDVRARKIDVIVVYKVDQLTRSLADFAKLVELFDAHCVSFMWSAQTQVIAPPCGLANVGLRRDG